MLEPLLAPLGLSDVRLLVVENRFFGGNVGVTGLMVGEDLIRTLSDEPADHRYLLPDVCLSQGRFLDGLTVEDLPRQVEVCLLYTSPSPRDRTRYRMPSSA